MHRPLGAQISHMLKDRGVDVIFGIPGVHNQEMYRGIEEAGLQHVLARHEQGAGFMADGYARATGRPGVCYVITGPGLCNIMTPMGQAYSDSVPMLVISSCLDETAHTPGQLHQMLDQAGAADCVADWSKVAQTSEAAYGLIDRALDELQLDRPRTKHIQIPIKVLEARAEGFGPQSTLAAATKLEIEGTLDAIGRAKRPLFIFGGGARHVSIDACAVLDAYNAAAFTTYAGKGIIPAGHPRLFGSNLARPDSAEVLAQADLVIAVGTELSEVDLWRDTLGHSCPFIRFDIEAEALARGPVGTHIKCRAEAALSRLLELAEKFGSQADWDDAYIATMVAKWRNDVDAERPGIMPVADALREALPPETMIYSDMTQFAYAALEFWPMDRPGHWHHPSGFGTLGYAMPAAIGGKIGVGDQPVVAIAGDYGFQYTLQELGAAVELGLSLPIIIWDNGKLGEIEDSMVAAQIAPNAVVQRNPDFCKLAEAYGAASAKPQTLEEMAKVVRSALTADGPTLIHLTTDIATNS